MTFDEWVAKDTHVNWRDCAEAAWNAATEQAAQIVANHPSYSNFKRGKNGATLLDEIAAAIRKGPDA